MPYDTPLAACVKRKNPENGNAQSRVPFVTEGGTAGLSGRVSGTAPRPGKPAVPVAAATGGRSTRNCITENARSTPPPASATRRAPPGRRAVLMPGRTPSSLRQNPKTPHVAALLVSVSTPPDFELGTRNLGRLLLERAMGIEPTWPAWKAGTLPLSYARGERKFTVPSSRFQVNGHNRDRHPPQTARCRKSTPFLLSTWNLPLETLNSLLMVDRGGFEPPKAEPSDLQSDPFGRSGTCPP